MEGEEIESHEINKLEEFVIDNDNVLLVLTEREYVVKGNSIDRLNECVKQVTDLTGVKLTDLLYNSFSDTVEEKFITYIKRKNLYDKIIYLNLTDIESKKEFIRFFIANESPFIKLKSSSSKKILFIESNPPIFLFPAN